MSWQLVAIWVIVSGTLIWFVRDERVMRRIRQSGRVQRFVAAPASSLRDVPARGTFRNDSPDAIAARQRFVDAIRNTNG